MSIHPAPCTGCEGTGRRQRWTRATFACGAVATPEECSPGVQRRIAEDPDGIDVEWETVECPDCDGTGEVTVERFPPGVRIFS